MSKFHGKIGFVKTEDDGTGKYLPRTIEREYAGEIYSVRHRYSQGNERNVQFDQSLELSIIADPFFNESIGYLEYVVYRGIKWSASSADLTTYPRVTVSIGGVYNG